MFWIAVIIGFIALLVLFSANRKISRIELCAVVGISSLFILALGLAALLNLEAIDREVWNGEISSKNIDKRDCYTYGSWHSSKDSFCTNYRTREVYAGETCTTDAKGNRSCTQHYNTEYQATYPWEANYYAYSKNLKTDWLIYRIDAQGSRIPPLYSEISVGDPASVTRYYTNWVKAASQSIFHGDGEVEEKYKGLIPEYPMRIYKEFRLDRIVLVGVDPLVGLNFQEYNRQLSNALKDLGPNRQMNAIIVISDADKTSPDFMYAVRRAWQGFKKNDAVIFIGMKDMKLVWADVLSWSKESAFNVELREAMLTQRDKPLDVSKVITNLHDIGMQKYVRRPMEEFEFLRSEVPTPWLLLVISSILQVIMLTFAIWFIRLKNLHLQY